MFKYLLFYNVSVMYLCETKRKTMTNKQKQTKKNQAIFNAAIIGISAIFVITCFATIVIIVNIFL